MLSPLFVKSCSIIALCSLFVQLSVSFDLPKDLVRCRPADDDCVLKRANEIVKDHPNGWPEILLPSFDPFRINSVHFSGSDGGPVSFNLDMNDLALYGYSNLTLSKFGGYTKDPKDIRIVGEGLVPVLILKGKYKVSGRLLVLPLAGNGDIVVNLKNLKLKLRAQPADIAVRDGKKYLKINLKLKLKVDRMTIDMSNLFNGDKILGGTILKVINENWQLLWDEIAADIADQINQAHVKVINGVMGNIPYDELFIIE